MVTLLVSLLKEEPGAADDDTVDVCDHSGGEEESR